MCYNGNIIENRFSLEVLEMKTSCISRCVLLFALLLFLFSAVGAKRPNFVIISASNLGYSDLGCYGSEINTPVLDKLAAEGLQFTQFYNCGNNAMSQAALMTGQYPHRVGMGFPMMDLGWKSYKGSLTNSTATMAEVLKSAGYLTYMSGKWGLTKNYRPKDPRFAWPLSRGFDKSFGTILSQTSYFEPRYLMMNAQEYPTGKDFYYTYETAKEAVHFLDGATGNGKPFFLYVAFCAPSWPLQAPEEEIQRYRNRYRMGWDVARTQRFEQMKKQALLPFRTTLPKKDERVADWSRVGGYGPWHARRMEVFAAQVSAMDRGVGMILEKLHQMGVEDDTVVIFLSDAGACGDELTNKTVSKAIPSKTDSGEPVQVGNTPSVFPGGMGTFQSYGVPWANVSNTPFRGYAEGVYEGGISSPFIVRWNNHTEPGKVLEPVHIIDVLPTVVELTERPFPDEIEGRNTLTPVGKSFTNLFSSKARLEILTDPEKEKRYFFWECKGNAAVRYGNWKLILPRNGNQWELYDMSSDRTEQENLFVRNQANPEIAKMISKFEAWKQNNRVQNWDDVLGRIRAEKNKKD